MDEYTRQHDPDHAVLPSWTAPSDGVQPLRKHNLPGTECRDVECPRQSAYAWTERPTPPLPRPGFWGSLTETEQAALLAAAEEIVYPVGTVLWWEGQAADQAVVICSGSIRVSVERGGHERIIAFRGPGDIIGERAALLLRRRSATIVAMDTVHGLRMTTQQFVTYLSEHPRVLAIMEREVYDRLTEQTGPPPQMGTPPQTPPPYAHTAPYDPLPHAPTPPPPAALPHPQTGPARPYLAPAPPYAAPAPAPAPAQYYATTTRPDAAPAPPHLTSAPPYMPPAQPNTTPAAPHLTSAPPYTTSAQSYTTSTRPDAAPAPPHLTSTQPYAVPAQANPTSTQPYAPPAQPHLTSGQVYGAGPAPVGYPQMGYVPDPAAAGGSAYTGRVSGGAAWPGPPGTAAGVPPHAAPTQPMPVPAGPSWPGPNCTIVYTDIVGFSAPHRNDVDRLEMRRAMYAVLREAFEESLVPWQACHTEDRGDGALIVVPPEVPTATVVDPMIAALAVRLRRHNQRSSSAVHIQLRVAADVGPVMPDPPGVTGFALIHTARLLDARPLKERLAATGADLGFIASQFVFESVITHGAGYVNPAEYEPISCRVKKLKTEGWIHLRGVPAQSAV